MTVGQILFGSGLVLLLVGIALYAGWRQWNLLRGLPPRSAPQAEEDVHLRWRAWRRMLFSLLMLVLAGLLAGALLFLEVPAQNLADRVDAEGPIVLDGPEQKAFVHLYSYYWIAFLLVLLLLVVVAGFDLLAIRAFGLKQFRRLQDDRRAMIARQSALLREPPDDPE